MTLVKICGLTREQDVDAAVAAGADMVGFVLVPDTPRYVEIDRAQALAARVPPGVKTVAVVDASVKGTVPLTGGDSPRSGAGFDLVQRYDDPGDFRQTIVAGRGEPPAGVPDDIPVMLDLAYGSRPDTEALHKHWERAARVANPVMLGGSLDPDNVADAIAAVHPWAVDTSRGVEVSPGVKDHERVREFVRNAKAAS